MEHMNAQQRNTNTVEQDGFIIDTESGEVLGLATQEFHVTDEASADWVLKKLTESEAEIIKLNLMLESVAERLASERKAAERKVEWLKARFGAELEQFAKENLPKGKRTWKGTWGEVSFRTSPARLEVTDEETAIKWAERNCPSAVKVSKKFLKSELSTGFMGLASENALFRHESGLNYIPETETMTIKTVKAAK